MSAEKSSPGEEVPMMQLSGDCGDNKSAQDSQTKLKRELTLIDGASMIIGIIVGSGIFVSPKGVLQYSGSVGLSCLVWTLSGNRGQSSIIKS